jgi:hypothetical protein
MSIETILERIAVALEGGKGAPAKQEIAAGPKPASVDATAKPGPGRPRRATAEPAPVKAAGKKLTAKDVADEVIALAATNRPAAIAILAEYGVTQVAQLKPEDYQPVLDATRLAPKHETADAEAPAKDPLE